ncbi:hypothetical protein NDU88_007767 [Pleurodeles waltl]|uniref:Uncharacterized protein n=1 Tax=Pleurodeles waltl TaxID=8319 RepID=A0AAV7NXH5_PLEWA|nr:hypothetical protein NDU88_007767 [Pleurodeles waltl]
MFEARFYFTVVTSCAGGDSGGIARTGPHCGGGQSPCLPPTPAGARLALNRLRASHTRRDSLEAVAAASRTPAGTCRSSVRLIFSQRIIFHAFLRQEERGSELEAGRRGSPSAPSGLQKLGDSVHEVYVLKCADSMRE